MTENISATNVEIAMVVRPLSSMPVMSLLSSGDVALLLPPEGEGALLPPPLLGVAPSLQQLASLGEVVAAVVLSYTLDPVHEANSPPPSVISPQVATNDVPVLLHF